MTKQNSTVPFDEIVIGLLLMMFGALGRSVFKMDLILIAFGILSWFYLLRGCSKIRMSFNANYIPSSYRLLLSVYLLICLVMIVRGYMIDYRYQWSGFLSAVRFHLFDQYYILPYVMPLVVFIPYRYYRFNVIVRWSVILAFVSVLLLIVYSSEIVMHAALKAKGFDGEGYMSGTEIVMYGKLAFIALCSRYITRKQWHTNILGLVVVALTLLIAARRGASLTYLSLLVFSLYIYSKKHDIISKFAVILFLLLGAYFVLTSSWFDYLFVRGVEDTRSGVEESLLSQMTELEKIFGQGLNGRYYFPLREDDYLNGWRYGIETGFYNIVLKGGYLMAYTYIVLLSIPAYRGLFRSKNQLCEAGGFYILLSLFELYPFGWLTFDVKFLVIWMMVVLCMNPSIRNMSDGEISRLFFPKNNKI